MQYSDEKTEIFAKALGSIIDDICSEKKIKSINNFADQYDIDDSNLNKIIKGKHNAKMITVYKISEALGVKFSDVAKKLEEKLGDNFTLIDK